jgi:hypothetical protein
MPVADEDEALRAAMELSLRSHQQQFGGGAGAASGADPDLELALQMSRSMMPGNPSAADPVMDQSKVTSEEDAIQQAIQASLASVKDEQKKPAKKQTWKEKREEELKKKNEDEDRLKKALAMSMGAVKKGGNGDKAPTWKRPAAPEAAGATSTDREKPAAASKPPRESFPGPVKKTFSPSGALPPAAAGTIGRGSLGSPLSTTSGTSSYTRPVTGRSPGSFGSAQSSQGPKVAGLSSLRSSSPPSATATSPRHLPRHRRSLTPEGSATLRPR